MGKSPSPCIWEWWHFYLIEFFFPNFLSNCFKSSYIYMGKKMKITGMDKKGSFLSKLTLFLLQRQLLFPAWDVPCRDSQYIYTSARNGWHPRARISVFTVHFFVPSTEKNNWHSCPIVEWMNEWMYKSDVFLKKKKNHILVNQVLIFLYLLIGCTFSGQRLCPQPRKEDNCCYMPFRVAMEPMGACGRIGPWWSHGSLFSQPSPTDTTHHYAYWSMPCLLLHRYPTAGTVFINSILPGLSIT